MEQVSGFDESFPIDFNDVDLCLRMRQAGYRIAYTPFAELYHAESAAAPRSAANPVEVQRFLARWLDMIDRDPYYNVNLSRDRLDFSRNGQQPAREGFQP